jgi:hypothetical protein
MADAKISALTELAATPATDDYLPIIDASEVSDASKNKRITVGNLFGYNSQPEFVPLTTPLTSTSWDGDARSTTGKTLIDLSDVFGAPAGIKAISAYIYLRDSGSAGSNTTYFGLSPNDTDGQLAMACGSRGLPNDYYAFEQGICPCDANGDVYYQCIATGSNTLDVWLEIWGYWL